MSITRSALEALADVSPSSGAAAGWVAVGVIVLACAALMWSASAALGSSVWRLWLRAAAVAAIFGALTAQVVSAGWLTRGDGPTTDWLIAHRSDTWTAIAKLVTNAGGPAGAIAIGVMIAVFLTWRTRRLVPGAAVLVTVAIAAVANTLMKTLIGRERPPAVSHLINETDLSYPSGHVAGTTALVGVVLLVYLAGRPGRVRAGIAALGAALIVVVIALTRLYLGVHWLSDTIGGALLGTTVVLAVAAVVASLPILDIRARTSSPSGSHALVPAR